LPQERAIPLARSLADVGLTSTGERNAVLKRSSDETVAFSSLSPTARSKLHFVVDTDPGITRKPAGPNFKYLSATGTLIRDKRTLARIRALVIPPAWTDVWICSDARGHIQATGRDARGRKQYRYHSDFIQQRDEAKYAHLIAFGKTLPKVRRTIARHMKERGLTRRKVLATVTYLLDNALIRVGNPEYARQNNSFGLTTLQNRHAAVSGSELRFKFRGKTGKEWKLKISDRRVARIVRSCQELPGQHLFQYEDDAGDVRQVTSSDVNDYIRSIAGPEVSAKDFRTWAGTVRVAAALKDCEPGSEKINKQAIRDAIAGVAAKLGNTPTICRKCYVDPEVLGAFVDGELRRDDRNGQLSKRRPATLSPEEALTIAVLIARKRRRRRAAPARQ